MINKEKKHIDDIFAQDNKCWLECFIELYRFLKGNEADAPSLLQYAMEINIVPEDEEAIEESKKTLFDAKWQDCRKMSQLVLERLSNLNEENSIFYKRLWEHISSSCYINDEERGYSMFAMAHSVRLPYHRIDEEVRMTNEDFITISKNIYPVILNGIQIILRRGGLQKTQVASLLLKEMNKLDTDEQKAVFWAQIMNYIEDDEEE